MGRGPAGRELGRAPIPPLLPPGRIVNVEGRGEMLVREIEGGGGGAHAPTIVLAHGWTLSADLNWFSGVYGVAGRYGRVVAPDLRGHGRGLRSEEVFTLERAADDLAALIRHLGAGPAVVVGYSMGGSVAVLCAERHPDCVAGLVLAATALQWRTSVWERVVWSALAAAEWAFRLPTPKAVANRYLRHAVARSPDLAPYCGWVKAEMRRGDPVDIGAAGRSLSTMDARELAPRIRVPTAVVVTAHDRLIRGHRQRQLAEAIPGAALVELDAAHNGWLVRPELFSAAIDGALRLVTDRLGGRCPSPDPA